MSNEQELNDLRNQVTLLKSKITSLEAEIEDLEYDCSDCASPESEAEDLIKLWKPELQEFIDHLRMAQLSVSTDFKKVIFLYPDQLEDIKELLTKLVKAV